MRTNIKASFVTMNHFPTKERTETCLEDDCLEDGCLEDEAGLSLSLPLSLLAGWACGLLPLLSSSLPLPSSPLLLSSLPELLSSLPELGWSQFNRC